eukprot:CAMPEP_0194346956 /NCGR_PEP_ID=MMETSP0171-20130528/105719_1 /TAXON_ID=218684 /ORGANISM="Corethron pennatum, Strain L29A3" /LENGTH=113 /DNA_ID=CAMNT_0039114145 /DNA_START=25 /DNA_END=366 /DNA_ORIENTATION=+
MKPTTETTPPDEMSCAVDRVDNGVTYTKNGDARCRTDSGGQGDEDDEYEMVRSEDCGWNLDDCRNKCSALPKCTGFEWNGRVGNCEIWFYVPQKFKSESQETKHQASCNWKNR